MPAATTVLLWLSLGALLGVIFVQFAGRRTGKPRFRTLAIGLVVAAAIYVVFAVRADAVWLATELGGALFFALLAYAALRSFPLLLALGWALHVGWDVGLHLLTAQLVVSSWYPLMCVSFDLIAAGYLVWVVLVPRREQETTSR